VSRTVSESNNEIPVVVAKADKGLKQGVKAKHTFNEPGAKITSITSLPGRDGQYAYTRADGHVYVAKVASKKESVIFKHQLSGNTQVAFTRTVFVPPRLYFMNAHSLVSFSLEKDNCLKGKQIVQRPDQGEFLDVWACAEGPVYLITESCLYAVQQGELILVHQG